MEKKAYTTAKYNKYPYWLCPRCQTMTRIDKYPATSRRDNRTEICSICGQDEALFDFYIARKDQKADEQLIISMRKTESEWMSE